MDTAANGMLLYGPLHNAWDNYAWTFAPVVSEFHFLLPLSSKIIWLPDRPENTTTYSELL